MVSQENLHTLSAGPKENTRPRCYYKNLHRFNRCFIAGSIAEIKQGAEDCVGGVKVVLKQEDRLIEEMISDDFGDFKFDVLEQDSGEYLIEISVDEKIAAKERFLLGASGSVGTIMLG